MPADLTREEIERRLCLTASSDAKFGTVALSTLAAMQAAVEQWRCEPTRLAAARAEGYREGVEAAARWHDEQARLFTSAGGRWDGAHTSALLTAAADHRRHAAAIRSLGGHHG